MLFSSVEIRRDVSRKNLGYVDSRLMLWAWLFLKTVASDFLTTWRTTTSGETITLPPISFTDISVNWGDGQSDYYDVNGALTHTYSVAGIYNVTVAGQFFGFRFDSSGDATKLIQIRDWGDGFMVDSNSTNMFAGCSNLQVSAPPSTQPVMLPGATLSGMFMNSSFNSPLSWDLTNVTSLDFMFAFTPIFNQRVNFTNTQNVKSVRGMFQNATAFNMAIGFRTTNVVYMDSMFQGAKLFNQPLNLNTNNVESMVSMFAHTTTFNQPINFNASALLTTASMFQNAVWFNSAVTLSNSSNLREMQWMFAAALRFNQPMTADTSSVQDMTCMFAWAVSFNQSVVFSATSLKITNYMFTAAVSFNNQVNLTNSRALTLMDGMFYGALSFNQPLSFDTSNVTNMSSVFSFTLAFNRSVNFNTSNVLFMNYMFANTRAFNQPVVFDAPQLQSAEHMFQNASVFNSPVTLANSKMLQSTFAMFSNATVFDNDVQIETEGVKIFARMFAQATRFNHEVNFDTKSAVDLSEMFLNASSFNRTVNFAIPAALQLKLMFSNAISFNSPLLLNATTAVVDCSGMFKNAASFNQPLSLDLRAVTTMESMFEGAASFSQPIDFRNDKLTTTKNMFRAATSFNQSVVIRGSGVLFTSEMFAYATSFNQTVTFQSTANMIDMDGMFFNALAFRQDLSSWDTNATVNCSDFCSYCGLPSFPLCVPCGGSSPIPRSNAGSVCNCPPDETCPPLGISPLCNLAQVSPSLKAECMVGGVPPTTSDRNRIILSPLFNITQDDSNASSFVFTLPIDPQVYTALGKITQACYGQRLSCEWQDPNTMDFQQSGCAVSQENVDMGSGIIGTQCTCKHLTVFAIVLRTQMQLAPLCQAKDIDYALLALYGALFAWVGIQFLRLWCAFLTRLFYIQLSLLLLVCALRIAYVIAKPVIDSLAGLVLLGLLPSALSLSLFVHMLLTWVSLQVSVSAVLSLATFKIPLVVASSGVFVLTLLIVISVAATEGDRAQQEEVIIYGSCVIAALYFAVFALVLVAGFRVRRTIGVLTDAGWRVIRCRVLTTTLTLSPCLLTVACLWVAAVQTDIIESSASTLATTASFYLCDWASLCVLAWALTRAIGDAVRKRKLNRESASDVALAEKN